MPSRYPVADKKDRFCDGILFDSKKELSRYRELKLLEKGGVIRNLEVHPCFCVAIKDEPFCTYTADFSYYWASSGKQEIEDVKSTGTRKDAAYRLRKKAAELFYGIKVTEVIAHSLKTASTAQNLKPWLWSGPEFSE
jgi:chloramphenicol O-acetyltransferase